MGTILFFLDFVRLFIHSIDMGTIGEDGRWEMGGGVIEYGRSNIETVGWEGERPRTRGGVMEPRQEDGS